MGGDAEMVFQQQCKADKKPNKSGKDAEEKGKDALWKDSSFAGLLGAVAKRKGTKPLSVIDDLWNTERDVKEEMEKKKLDAEFKADAKKMAKDKEREERDYEKNHYMKSKSSGSKKH